MSAMGKRSSLVDYYWESLERLDYQPRSGIEQSLRYLEDGKSVILTAPTAYGKTTVTKVLALAAERGNELFDRVIHVLPLRSIVQDLYLDLQCSAKKLGIYPAHIAAQDMDFSDSPFFMKKVNVTTLDTFIMNLFKLPVAELRSALAGGGSHYEVPRGFIYSSIVLFDEFHLFPEEGGGKAVASCFAAMRSLKDMGVPMLIMTATLPSTLRDALKKVLSPGVEEVSASDFRPNRKINVKFVESPYDVPKGQKVLVVFNTRTEAIQAYDKIKSKGDHNPILIHSKFNRVDRMQKISEMDSHDVVISTQVIEAGINRSFDMLITEAAPPSSLIQRAGRVKRKGGEGEVWIFPFRGKVYDRELVKRTTESVEKTGTIADDLIKLDDRDVSVDVQLQNVLEKIDDSVFINSPHWLLERVCALTRDTSLVLGFPPSCTSADCAVPLSEDEARRQKKVLQNGKEAEMPNSRGGCLSLDFLRQGIDGVVISGYDSERGAVI